MTGNLYPTSTSAPRRALIGLVAGAIALLLGAGVAGAQDEPYNPEPRVSVADGEVCEGDSVIVTVSNVDSGDSIEVTFAGQSASLTAGSTGTASTAFGTGDTAPGTHTVSVTTGAGGSTSASVTVVDDEVCDPEPPPTLSIADPSVCGGESAVATVSNGAPGGSVTITFAGQSAVVTIGADGTASTSFPTSGLAPGEYSFVATDGNGVSASAPLFVLSPDDEECAPPPPPPGPELSVSAADTCAHEPLVVTVTGAGDGDDITISLAGNATTVAAGPNGSVQTSLSTDGLDVGTADLLATSSAGAGASTQVNLLGVGDGCGEVRSQGGARPQPEAASSDPSGPLAFSGSYTWPMVAAGLALIGAGVVIAWRSRRTRATQ